MASTFRRHMECFPQIAKDAEARGIEIIVIGKGSAIKEFPKYDLEEVI